MQPNTSNDESLVLYLLSSGDAYYTIFRNSVVTGEGEKLGGRGAGVLLAQVGEEVHFQRIGQLRRGFEREVDVAGKDFCYVRPRDIHPPCELGLRHPKLLHPSEYPTKEGRADMVDCCHRSQESGISSQESGGG